eukprot:116770-Hanusia_phi.AAC.1
MPNTKHHCEAEDRKINLFKEKIMFTSWHVARSRPMIPGGRPLLLGCYDAFTQLDRNPCQHSVLVTRDQLEACRSAAIMPRPGGAAQCRSAAVRPRCDRTTTVTEYREKD